MEQKLNEGQKKFYEYILEKVRPEESLNAEELLKEAFSNQADQTFDEAYVKKFIPQMLNLIRKENQEEVKNIMQNFHP